MEMTYDGALVMPMGCAMMDEEEMTYLEGGLSSTQLKVSRAYLNKSTCSSVAKNYMKATGLSQSRIAKEIFAHAVLFYGGVAADMLNEAIPTIQKSLVKTATSYIISHSNPIDLGNDNIARVAVFTAIWALPNLS